LSFIIIIISASCVGITTAASLGMAQSETSKCRCGKYPSPFQSTLFPSLLLLSIFILQLS